MSSSKYKCETCKDTEVVQTQRVCMGRSYMTKKFEYVAPFVEYGDWQDTPCYDCVACPD